MIETKASISRHTSMQQPRWLALVIHTCSVAFQSCYLCLRV